MGLFSDKHYHTHNKTEYVTHEVTKNVNITEKRAPTDESIKILREMEEKTREQIVHSFYVDQNCLKAVAIFWRKDECMMVLRCLFRYEINGHSFQDECEIDRRQIRKDFAKEKESLEDAVIKRIQAHFCVSVARMAFHMAEMPGTEYFYDML